MDVYMQNYFEDVFSKMGRDFLNQRYKRQELVEYLNTVIVACAKGENITDETSCTCLVRSVIKFHNQFKASNGNVCLMGKYHNILYIAMKLAFDWSLQNNGIVAALLDEIFACEGTFERLFLGAIFGTSAPHFLAGWKSDFKDKEENIHALVFFLDHATNANLEYTINGKTHRFIDVPLESCGKAPPVRVVIQMCSSEMLMILLRFGAKVTNDDAASNAVEVVLDKLNEHNRVYPYELVSCLEIIFRAVPRLVLPEEAVKEVGYNEVRKVALEKYGDLLQDHLIPSTRCGLKPVELKHLCRCAVRERLWENFELPFGIQILPIPGPLKKYLDLFED